MISAMCICTHISSLQLPREAFKWKLLHYKQQEGIVRSFFTPLISVAASIPIKLSHYQELLETGAPNVNHTRTYTHTLQVSAADRGSTEHGTD